MSNTSRLLVAGLTTSGLAGATLALTESLPPSSAGAAARRPFTTLLIDIAEVALFGVCAWLALATAVTTLAAARGPESAAVRVAVRVTPRFWCRALSAVLGGAVLLGPVGAHAAYDDSTTPGLVGLRVPDRPSGVVAPPSSKASQTHIVRRGDTLWAIAADTLPRGSTAAETAHECRRWYAANHAAIGSDPDLLVPGTRLHPPLDDRKGKQ